MSLLTWLGSTNKVNDRSLSPILPHRGSATATATATKNTAATNSRLVLGVLGTRSNIRSEDLDTNILEPILEAWGFPDELLLPAEGDSSQALQRWADLKDIPVRLVTCDWTTQGRKASVLRDARIQRDATHLLLLQGPRSNALRSLAERLHRKGRPVVLSERPGLPVISVSVDNIKSVT
jgi:hypothetical protein